MKILNPLASARYAEHGHFHAGDAGLDLYALERIEFAPGETRAIRFGIACEPADGRAYWLLPRSSISKTPLRMANSVGLIDGGYRGEIMAMCDNVKGEPYVVEPGQRLFQLAASDLGPITYELADDLTTTSRGTGGFGSTG